MRQPRERRITIRERRRVPWDGAVLGYAAVLPFPAAALAAWLGGDLVAGMAVSLVRVWGGLVLLFLAGVRRGLSFRTPGGPRWSQVAVALALFALGATGLLAPEVPGLAALIAGHAIVMLLDPAAARRAEAPLYFARLRPPQMGIAVASLALVLAAVLGGRG